MPLDNSTSRKEMGYSQDFVYSSDEHGMSEKEFKYYSERLSRADFGRLSELLAKKNAALVHQKMLIKSSKKAVLETFITRIELEEINKLKRKAFYSKPRE